MKETNKNRNLGMALGMCFGVSIGAALGSSLGNVAMGSSTGMCIGMAIGLVLGSLTDKEVNKQLEESGYTIKDINQNEQNGEYIKDDDTTGINHNLDRPQKCVTQQEIDASRAEEHEEQIGG